MEMKQCTHNRVVIDALETVHQNLDGWLEQTLKIGIDQGFSTLQKILGEQWWRRGESTRLPPMWPGFVMFGLTLLALYSPLRGFSPGTLIFPSPQNPTFDKI